MGLKGWSYHQMITTQPIGQQSRWALRSPQLAYQLWDHWLPSLTSTAMLPRRNLWGSGRTQECLRIIGTIWLYDLSGTTSRYHQVLRIHHLEAQDSPAGQASPSKKVSIIAKTRPHHPLILPCTPSNLMVRSLWEISKSWPRRSETESSFQAWFYYLYKGFDPSWSGRQESGESTARCSRLWVSCWRSLSC